jgi:hypothetical protein
VTENNEPVVEEAEDQWVRLSISRREVTGPEGTPIVVDGSMVTDETLPLGSIVWEGTVATVLSGATDNDLYEVLFFKRVPDVRGEVVYREAMLSRFKGTLPQVRT